MEDGDTSAHLKSDDKTPATNTSASTQPPPEENIVKLPTSSPPVIQSLGSPISLVNLDPKRARHLLKHN
jgi:hypothetical protein